MAKIIDLLQEVTNQKDYFDWVRFIGKKRKFVSPKRTTTAGFEDGLGEVIPIKLEELLKRKDEIEKEQKERQEIIQSMVLPKHQRFWKEIDIAWFEEYFVIEKWIKYWVHLQESTRNWKEVIGNEGGKITDEDIAKAKEFLIEDMYIGTLRKSGIRLTGNCLFHEEDSPSFFIFPDNSWWCFGCNQGGDSISFKMRLDDINFIEAVKQLR